MRLAKRPSTYRYRRASSHVEMLPLEQRQLCALNDNFGTVQADGNDAVSDSNGVIHRIWRDTATGRLHYATRSRNQTWSAVSVVDTRRVGGEMSLALDSANRPMITYYDRLAGDLYFAQLAGNTWAKSRLDFIGDVGDFSSITVHQNKPFVSYYNRTKGDLKLAWRTSSGRWLNQTVETAGDVGAYSSIAATTTGYLRIAYADVTGMRLKFASQNNDGTWFVRSLDKTTTAGVRYTSLTIDRKNNAPYIAYYDVAKKDLRLASELTPAGAWTCQRVASNGMQGEFANLYFDSGGQLNVAYMNRSLGTVNKATLGANSTWKFTTLAVGGEHLSVARSANGVSSFNFFDSRSGELRTTTQTFEHTPATAASQRIIHWETIGFSSGIAADHYVGWSIKQNGWSGFVRDRVNPIRALGVERLFLHNPFGVKPGTAYFQFDQYLDAQAAGLTWLTNGFAEAFKPVTDSGMEVIAYIGRIFGDPDFENIVDHDAYMDRVMKSIKPLLDAGCSIGLDSIVNADNNTRAFMVANALRASGVRVYAENRPPASATYWHDFGGVYYNRGFIADNPAVNPNMHWAATNNQLRGEVIRYTAVPPPGFTMYQPGWRVPEIIDILRRGDTAATDVSALIYDGVTVAQVMAMAGDATGGQARPPAQSTSGSLFSSSKIDDIKDEVL